MPESNQFKTQTYECMLKISSALEAISRHPKIVAALAKESERKKKADGTEHKKAD